jgi:hypothetical protein
MSGRDDTQQRQRQCNSALVNMSRHSSFDERPNGQVKKEMTPDKKEPKTDDASVTSYVSNFLQRMFDPSITRALESRMPAMHADLLHVPWTLSNENETDANANGDDDDKTCAIYPSFSYLDLRRIQNTQWATERLKEGIRLQKENQLTKAETCYKEGIDLVPTHAELFVAYGTLCANVGRTKEAIEKLQHAIELQPDVPNAQHYLNAIRKQQTPTRQAGSVIRSETAMKDALMERSFFQGRTKTLNANDEKYPLLYNDNDNNVEIGERRHCKKHSKARRHRAEKSRKKRKRRERSSTITSDESSGRGRGRRRRHRGASSEETSEESSRSKGRRRRRHGGASGVQTSDESSHCKRRQRKRDRRRDSSEETSEESSRRRRRRRNSRRHDSSSSSDSSRDRERRKEKRRKSKKTSKKSRSPSGSSVSKVATDAMSEAL